jgi:hypothetical protein
MKKIAIDLNDVVRDYSKQYAYYFDKAKINEIFDPDKLKYKDGDIYSPFEFSTKKIKEDFENVDYVFEIHASAKPTDQNLPGKLNIWLNDLIDEFEDSVEVSFISPGEVHLQRQATLFFLSKICSRVETVWFPKTIEKMWSNCDILITANPKLLENVPEGKITIKIETEYNKKSNSTYSYNNILDIIEEEKWNNIKLLLEIE